MATAKRLPSGSWRCQVYSHSAIIRDENGKIVLDKNGKPKQKRIYASFTSENKTKRGKIEAESLANQFILERKDIMNKEKYPLDITVYEAINKYIDSRRKALSISTIEDYETIRDNAFQDIMHLKLKDLDENILQDAVNVEADRPSQQSKGNTKPISPKRLRNEYGLLRPALKKYRKDIDYSSIAMEKPSKKFRDLLPPDEIYPLIKESTIELPVLLAMWLSFSMSEIRGLTKSKSIRGDYITIVEVVIDTNNGPYRKELAKNEQRNRRHRMPDYIHTLIDQVDGDIIVPMTGNTIYNEWVSILKLNNKPKLTFHDLRHVSASVMALLKIPDKYAQERGGWKTDHVMKNVYMETFSDERIKVDNIIDNYYNDKIQHDMQHENEKTTK